MGGGGGGGGGQTSLSRSLSFKVAVTEQSVDTSNMVNPIHGQPRKKIQ